MRDIKFRAWHKEGKILRDVLEISFAGNYLILRGFGSFGEIEAAIPEVELMQYTGLCDREWTEIYEGDIVKFDSSIPYPDDYGVKDGDMGIISFELSRFVVRPIGQGAATFYLDELGDWLVIGNIYQNPELLKDIK